jgi:hypothetical protein
LSPGPRELPSSWDGEGSFGAALAAVANLRCLRAQWLDPSVSPEAVVALKAALSAAARDPALRARAIAALRGAELWAATWPSDPSFLRTLTSSSGVTALPVFSDERELQEASQRYAWGSVDGQAPRCTVALWEAMRVAKQQKAQLLVIDIASEHALELDEGDMELLSAPPSSKPPARMQKVRSTPPPPSANVVTRASARPSLQEGGGSGTYSPLRPRTITPNPGAHTVSATFGATPTATMQALETTPSEELLDELAEILREYPEVEWACLVTGARADHVQSQSIALRIEPAFHKNLAEIAQKLREVGALRHATYDVLVLDTPEQMKQARQIGFPFYPWRK